MTIVGVAGSDTRDAMAEFVARHDLGDMVHIADLDGEIWRRFGVTYQPTWGFLDDGGDVEVSFRPSMGEVREAFEALLAG